MIGTPGSDVAGAFVGYHAAMLPMLGGAIVTSVIAAAAGAPSYFCAGAYYSNL